MNPRCRTLIGLAVVCLVVAAPPVLIRAAGGSDATRITAAANVTVRALPAADAPAVTRLALGTELQDAGPAGLDKTWVRVRLADGREGWLEARLTAPLDPVWRWRTFDRVIADRLGRKGDGFPALAELASFVDRVAPEYTDPDGGARIELSRLEALGRAAAAIPARAGTREPYASWLKAHSTDVVFDEPGGRWMLAVGPIWDMDAREASTSTGDDIGWFAVTTGLGGECEGFVTCYLERRNSLQGEYLRRHPAGGHVDEAIADVKDTADRLAAPPKPQEAYEFDRARDCSGITTSVDALTTAVKRTQAAQRDQTMASLAALRTICQ